MRTRSVPALAAVCLLAGAGMTSAAPRVDRTPVDPQPVLSATKFWRVGPSVDYDGDSGGIGEVRPLHVAIPDDAAAYEAVIEITTTYRCRFGGVPDLTANVFDGNVEPGDGPPIDYLAVLPHKAVPLAPVEPPGGTTTARFLSRGLDGGSEISVAPSVNAAEIGRDGRFLVISSNVVLTVELTPVG